MRIPTSTYRLQFNPSFGFEQAGAIIEYLSELGISDIYASPIFKASKGSRHGYDITDPNQLNPELGDISAFENMMRAVNNYQMGWLQDIVPNHMAYDSENRLLLDVLEKGRNSRYADFFDIRWDFAPDKFQRRILAPFLGKPPSEALEQGEINVEYDDGNIWLCYYKKKFQLRLKCYQEVLFRNFQQFEKTTAANDFTLAELNGNFEILRSLDDANPSEDRENNLGNAKKRLWQLYTNNPKIKKCFDDNIAPLNEKNKTADIIEFLNRILSEQFYKLAFWRDSLKGTNYRRFFYIDDLIALKTENPAVFDYTHRLILKLVKEKYFTGLRIDHIDGLYDPAYYLRTLTENARDTYIVVEKILDLDENLPDNWPVHGTTGYDFLNFLNGLFCKPEAQAPFTELYQNIANSPGSYDYLLCKSKKLIIDTYMSGDVDYLVCLLQKIAFEIADSTAIKRLRTALVEMLANFPVYRTYITASRQREQDAAYIQQAITKAKENAPDYAQEYDLISQIFMGQSAYTKNDKSKSAADFISRFQQLSGSVTAKGLEDTHFYNYNRFVSLNEVGANPAKFGLSIEQFHRFNINRAAKWPHSLNATSTHDTKRGEDVRARLNVLSEMPEQWQFKINKWSEINRHKKRKINEHYVPDNNDEYLLYQTLSGAWPFDNGEIDVFKQRLKDYIIKALREAKINSSWTEPSVEYEQGFTAFIDAILDTSRENKFLRDFLPFQQTISHFGVFNSLSQLLVKITSPGIPDFYQGCELWNLSLVDPDNRRPVDYDRAKELLSDIKAKSEKDNLALINELLAAKEDGRIKLFLIWKALAVRKRFSVLFEKGTYQPLQVCGPYKNNVIAFSRIHENKFAIAIAPRFLTEAISENQVPIGKEVWKDTALTVGFQFTRNCKNCITEATINIADKVYLADALDTFPVCLLYSD